MQIHLQMSFISISDNFRAAREYESLLRQPPVLYNERRRYQCPLPQMPRKSRLSQNDRNLVNTFGGKFLYVHISL